MKQPAESEDKAVSTAAELRRKRAIWIEWHKAGYSRDRHLRGIHAFGDPLVLHQHYQPPRDAVERHRDAPRPSWQRGGRTTQLPYWLACRDIVEIVPVP